MEAATDITLRVDGQNVTKTVEPDMPLLWFLRDYLKVTEVKFGCGIARCGACTVHVDGRAVRSCALTIGDCVGKQITTLRGLNDSVGKRVQQAWIEHQVPQCGYCQPGQMMSAAALVRSNQNPSDDEIDVAMAGNLCRCGTYPRIKKAIKSL